jgi:hypothetical protein
MGISTPPVKASSIPPSLQVVRESAVRPPRLGASAEGGNEHWDEVSKTWKTLIFPVAKPVGRNDVHLLDEWLKSTLLSQEKAYKQHVQAAIDSAEPLSNARKVMILVNQTIPVLTAAMNEVIRQVSVQCVERGQILDNVWSSFMEIFDKVLGETTSTMSVYQQKMDQLQADNTSYVLKLQSERGRYLEAIKNEKQTVEVRMTAKLDTLKEKLSVATAELKKASAAESECKLFFPRSAIYRKSVLREMLHEIPASQINTNVLPDDALAQDIVRLVDLLGGNQSRQRLDVSNGGSVSPIGASATEEVTAGGGDKDKEVKGSMRIVIPSPSALLVNRSETDNSVRELLLKQLNQMEKENKTLKQSLVAAERKHVMMMGEISTLENKVLDLKSNLRIALNSSTSGATSLQQFLGDREVMISQNISSDPTKSLDKMKANIRILATLTTEDQGGLPQASMEEISLLELGVPLQMRRVGSLEKLCWLLLKRKLDLTTPTRGFTTTKIRSLCEITFEHFLGVGGSYSNGRRQLSYFIESLQMLASKSTLLHEFARLTGLDKNSKVYSHSTLELYFQLLHKIYLEPHKHWKLSVATAIGAIKAVNMVEVDDSSHGGITENHAQHSPTSTRRRTQFLENMHATTSGNKDSRDAVRLLYHISLTRELYADLVSLLTEVSDKDGYIDIFVFLQHVAHYWEQVEGQTTSVLESLFTGADVSCGNASMLLDSFMLYMKWAYPKLDPESITDIYNTCVSNPRNVKVGFISPSVFAQVIKEDLGFGVPPEFKKSNLMSLPRAATEVVDTWIDEEGDKFVARIRDLVKADPYTYSGLERRLQHVYKCNDKSGTGISTKYPESSWFALKIFMYEYSIVDGDTKEGGSSFGKKLASIANYLPVTFNRRKVLPKVFDAWREITRKQLAVDGPRKSKSIKKRGSTSPVQPTRGLGVTGVVTTLKAVNKMHRRIRAIS